MSVFVDAWAWLASFDNRDPDHELAHLTVLDAIRQRVRLVTTDYVLAETITLLFRRHRVPDFIASHAVKRMFEMQKEVCVQIEHIYPDRFSRAFQLRFVYEDKPGISFADLTSMVVMEELRIHDIITKDRDFLSVNRGFRLLPEA